MKKILPFPLYGKRGKKLREYVDLEFGSIFIFLGPFKHSP